MPVVTSSGVELPSGDDLIAAYKKTGAVPDYADYWRQNSHVHACAVGVLLGERALGRGKHPGRSIGRLDNVHATLSRELDIKTKDDPDFGRRVVRAWEGGVSSADHGYTLTEAMRSAWADLIEETAAGYRAWKQVQKAVKAGELPDKDKLPEHA